MTSKSMTSKGRLGFIGLGVMGEPICRNLARKSGLTMQAYDIDSAALVRLEADAVTGAGSIAELMARCDIVFLSLPSGEVVQQISLQAGGLLEAARSGQVIVDLSTSAVDTTRELAQRFAAKGLVFVDAPVARTRAAAEAGTLSVMVGAEPAVFDRLHALLATFASDITLCGPVGCGQVVKILNNMVLFETVVAICEAKAIGERAGVDATLLFDTLTKGSADSFALRNHGIKAVLPGEFPQRAFSVRYARKDLAYALKLAAATGVDARAAHTVDAWFGQAIDAGLGDDYHPVISRLIGAER